ncbi:unnamed protein product [marine sediment metagenome]|uniref:Uncharacterized protein n=1 Tax=marine sediment metagenome TaxID=412755 RepID=X1BKG5_9ZZZZ
MDFQRKWIILLGAISIFIILVNGCTYITPDNNYDYDSYTVSYIRVSPSSATMKVNTSKIFKVLAYDSEDNLIPVDPSGVDWIASYQCWVCGKVWKLNPESGSISTYFTPEKTGDYLVFAHYKEKWDYSSVEAE